MKKFLLTLALLCVSTVASAQTATPSKLLAWDQPSATQAEAQAMTFKYYPDSSTTGTALASVTCTGTTTITCTTPFPAFTPGAHTLTLSATNVAGEGPKSVVFSFTFVVVPSAPVNLRIQ